MRNVFTFLLPEYVLNWRNFWITFVWAELLHLSDTTTTLPGFYLERILIIFVCQIVAFAVIWVANQGILRYLPSRFLAIGVATVVVIAGALRGVFMYYSFALFGVQSHADLATRIASSTANTLVEIAVVALVLGTVQSHQSQRSLLEARQALLLELKEAVAQDLELLDSSISDEIEIQLRDSIQKIVSSSGAIAIANITKAIDEVVRPLSQLLHDMNPLESSKEPEVVRLKVDWRLAIRSAMDPENLSPTWEMVSLAVLGLPIMLSRYGLVGVLFILGFGGLLGWSFLWLAKRYWQRIKMAKRTSFARAAWLILPLYVAGQIIGFCSFIMSQITGKPGPFLYLAPIYGILLGYLFAIAITAYHLSQGVEAESVQINRSLTRAVARAQESQRQRKQSLSHILHGRIQAALSASYLRYKAAGDDSRLQSQVLIDLNEQVATALKQLHNLQRSQISIGKVAARTKATWQGVADIEIDVSNSCAKRIELDAICQGAVNDLITELVFNSIKHANATVIRVTITDEENDIVLKVLDDGTMSDDAVASSTSASRMGMKKGLGTELLTTCSLFWSRTRFDLGTEVHVVLPLEVA